MRRWFAAALAALLPQAALADADPPPPPWHGVWQGTVGALPVQACLQQSGGSWVFGSYYYRSQLKPIALEHKDDGSWRENTGKDAATLTFASAGADRLSGEWRQGAKQLPIALSRVDAGADADSPCGSRAFIAPRVRPVTRSGKPAHLGTFAYTALTYHAPPSFSDVSLESFAYPPSQPGDRAINAALALDPDKADGEADWLSCITGALGGGGGDGEFNFARAPKAVTAKWLTVRQSAGGYCGGAHPDYGYSWLSFDRASGQKLRLKRWFGKAEDENDGSEFELSPALRTLVVARMKIAEKDCREAVGEADFWSLGLGATGMIFTPSLPHVVQACTDDATVPYPALRRFLTPEGRAGFARLGLR